MAASGTETTLTGNYRSSTGGYYAALSGLEEARGRLLSLVPFGTTMPLGQAYYIINPLGGETVDPTSANPANYPDTEFAQEFGSAPSPVQTFASTPSFAGQPNAFYKWVRINGVTEKALGINVNNSGGLNTNQLIYFDGANLTRTVTPYQALGITALAALPDGSRKLLQYIAAPVILQLQIPLQAALTLEGPGTVANIVTFNQPPGASYSFQVNGNDQAPGSSGGLTCTPQPTLPAIGVLNSNDYSYLHDADLISPHPDHYTGSGGTATVPSISFPYVTPVHQGNPSYDMTDPASLLDLVQLIQGSADAVLTGPATAGNMPPGMSFGNPQTVVVKGDLTLSGGFTGYGLLVVTGKLTYTGDSGWKGIVLVIGQGVVEETGSLDGGEFDGAFFVANTGNGTTLGPASYSVASPGGKGIYYNSCWVAAAQKPIKYVVLSFHEIPYS